MSYLGHLGNKLLSNLYRYARNNPVRRIDPFGLVDPDAYAEARAAAAACALAKCEKERRDCWKECNLLFEGYVGFIAFLNAVQPETVLADPELLAEAEAAYDACILVCGAKLAACIKNAMAIY